MVSRQPIVNRHSKAVAAYQPASSRARRNPHVLLTGAQLPGGGGLRPVGLFFRKKEESQKTRQLYVYENRGRYVLLP